MTDRETEKRFSEVIATFEKKTNFNCAELWQFFTRCVWIYYEHVKIAQKIARSRERVSSLKAFRKRIAALDKALAGLRADPYINRAVNDAARYVDQPHAVAGSNLVQRFIGQLKLLGDVIAAAETAAIATKEPSGGNRPDAALHELIPAVSELYMREAAVPREPNGWAADTNDGGELLNLLQATLRPLGIKKTNAALRKMYQRAKARSGGT